MKKYDYLLVGAGLFSATLAVLAREAGKRCLVALKAGTSLTKASIFFS